MRALVYIIPILIATLMVVFYLDNNGYFDRRALIKDTNRYFKKNPDHSKNEPVTWQCSCGHQDYEHLKTGVCKGGTRCTCTLTPRMVRARYL